MSPWIPTTHPSFSVMNDASMKCPNASLAFPYDGELGSIFHRIPNCDPVPVVSVGGVTGGVTESDLQDVVATTRTKLVQTAKVSTLADKAEFMGFSRAWYPASIQEGGACARHLTNY